MAWCPRASSSVPHSEGRSLEGTLMTVSALSARCDRSPMTVRGGGVPYPGMALMPPHRMGLPPRSFAADAHDCIMDRVSHPPNTSMWARSRATASELPSSYVIPTTPSVPSCSELSRYGLAMMGARGNVGATPNLDSPCARQRLGYVDRAKKRAPDRTKKLTKKKDEPLRRGLTKKAPYKPGS